MSWASQGVPDAQAEYDQALADLERLRERVDAGKADSGALTLAEYRVARASKRLTRAVTNGSHDGGDAA